MNVNEFKVIVDKGMYSCNPKKNNICPKTCCYYKGWKYGCTNTSHWEYAKRTPWNYLIRAIHRILKKPQTKYHTFEVNDVKYSDNIPKNMRIGITKEQYYVRKIARSMCKNYIRRRRMVGKFKNIWNWWRNNEKE